MFEIPSLRMKNNTRKGLGVRLRPTPEGPFRIFGIQRGIRMFIPGLVIELGERNPNLEDFVWLGDWLARGKNFIGILIFVLPHEPFLRKAQTNITTVILK